MQKTQVIVGRVVPKRIDTRIIVSTPGYFNWVQDVAKAYRKDLRDGMRNKVTKVIWR